MNYASQWLPTLTVTCRVIAFKQFANSQQKTTASHT